jgi:hypothetical protein
VSLVPASPKTAIFILVAENLANGCSVYRRVLACQLAEGLSARKADAGMGRCAGGVLGPRHN